MLEFANKGLALLGYGTTNRALLDYFLKNGIYPDVYSENEEKLPQGIRGIFGDEYLNINADIVFRSPSIRPDKIKTNGTITSALAYALERAKCHKIGITGSDGKTTTSSLIHKILEADKKNSFLVGNVGTPVISVLDRVNSNSHLVCELSSFQLFDYTPTLDVAVITNITENHLNWHTSMCEYIFAKRNILKKARRAVINLDSKYSSLLTHESTSYFSLNSLRNRLAYKGHCAYLENGMLYCDDIEIIHREQMRLKGDYNVANALSAILATYDIVKIDSIREALKEFSGVESRNEEIAEINGVKYFDSSIDSTPSRTKETLSIYPKERLILILGGQDKGLNYDILGDSVRAAKLVIVLGENRKKILKGIEGCPQKIINVNTLSEATWCAYKNADEGDFVVLSPASTSFDMFKNYKERSTRFKELVMDLKNGKNI